MFDIEYFDDLPISIKELLREAPVPFSAKFARQLLDSGLTERQVCVQLIEACNHHTVVPFRPLKRRQPHKVP